MDLNPAATVAAPQGFAGHERARAAAALRVEAGLGLVLVPTFWALDWMVMPSKVAELFVIRAVPTVAAASLLALALVRPAALARHALPLGFAFSWLVAASITAMCFLHNGYESPYYAGINLVVMFVGLLYSWPAGLSLAFAALVQGTYMAPLWLGFARIHDPPVALTHVFFLVSVALITVVSQSTRRLLERREFEARAAQARLLAEVEALATTDALTGLWNRRQVLRLAQDAKLRSDRYGHPLSIVLLDIDHFKSVNDTWGHSVGDEVITEVARRIQASLRATDFAGRYGGEEFLVVLPETEAEFAAEVVAERLRAAVAAIRVRTAAGLLPVTISLGVARALPAAEALGAAIDRADAALYAAKRGGRDQVALAPAPVVELASGGAGADPPAAAAGA